MATPGELRDAVSRIMGVKLVRVDALDRELAKRGFRSKSGRGSSAAKVTPRDAAALCLITMIPDSTARAAGDAIERVVALRCESETLLDYLEGLLKRDHPANSIFRLANRPHLVATCEGKTFTDPDAPRDEGGMVSASETEAVALQRVAQSLQNPTLKPNGADLLHGAEEIALFLFGDSKKRRRVYHLAEKGTLPVFHIGALLCARKTTIMRWIEDQENANQGANK